MRHWQLGLTSALAMGVALAGCAAGNNNHGGSSSTATGGAGGLFTTGGTGGSGGFGACAKFNDEAQQAPAAMLIVLDRTASMAAQSKWAAAQIAIVQAIDSDVFDTMSLGLLTFPEPNAVPGPACIFNFPIYCAASALPQIAVKPAGTAKSSDTSGVRHEIYDYLTKTGPESADASDSSPIYAALSGAYQFIKSVQKVDKRVVVLITDGGGSCTSIATPPRPAYTDNNGCQDWEQPPVMAKLISDAANDKTAPVNTFIVGVPGSDSTGAPVGGIDTPPYHMRLALSTYAVAGSPGTLDPACDQSATFSQSAPDPAHPCHFDLSGSSAFNASALSSAIAAIRGKALGCTYDLPTPPAGQAIDPSEVNVVLTVNGQETVVPRRKDANDTCASSPCWDYDAQGEVSLIGAACTEVTGATDAKVEVYVGCATIVQ
jgi:hypothetical protein